MSLSINEKKVKEMLKEVRPKITISPMSIGNMETYDTMPHFYVSSTASAEMVSALPNYRDDLLLLRRKIEESGVTLKSPEELEKELDEMRGRT